MKDLLLDRLLRRETRGNARQTAIKPIYGDKAFVQDLDIVNELGGHSGCVNALSWSRSGNLLASGSDDQHLNIHSYQPAGSVNPFSLVTTVSTGHRANIFSVKFMPEANDRTLVTCAGDSEVRVFDIEYSGRSNITANLSDRDPPRIRHHLDTTYKGVRYLNQDNTNARVYRSHADRVKRIVTESSPYLFLTCSEDGEVRQFDLRLPSSAYPAPRGGRGLPGGRTIHDNGPPPLISYKRYGLDLNTMSCSSSQPHYIALGGAHLHCFLHDRRMLGRDISMERGQPAKTQAARNSSDHDAELMGQATKCVRKFAPDGRKNMRNSDNGHITACKISDANPNELLASWSGDHIYSFDIVRTPDASSLDHPPDKSLLGGLSNTLKSKSISGDCSRNPKNALDHGQLAGAKQTRTDFQNSSAELAKKITKLRRLIFGLGSFDSTAAGSSLPGPGDYTFKNAGNYVPQVSSELSGTPSTRDLIELPQISATLVSTLELSAKCLADMDDNMRAWHYPLNPTEEEVMLQRTLRNKRNVCRQFVQAVSTLSRVLLTLSSTSVPEPRSLLDTFRLVSRGPDEKTSLFRYDFLKAILLWVGGGTQALIEGFEGSAQRRGSQDFAIPTGVGRDSGLDDYLIPHLLLVAGERPVLDVDASRFEKDEHRKIFETETSAVEAFARVARMSMGNAHEAAHTDTQDQEVTATFSAHGSRTLVYFWGFKVGRGLLLNAGDGIDYSFVDVAFGGTGRMSVEDEDSEGEGRSQSDISIEPGEEVTVMQGITHEFEYRRPEGQSQEDESNDKAEVDNTDSDEDDNEANTEWHAGRGNSRKAVEVDVDCSAYVRKYSGHCNVRTVKDVNFFGLQDDYVVSGSDCGNLFIWDKRTSQLLSILSADSEVVNVVQGHPYEPVLAASGIDNTIKIFSPDARAQANARAGIDLGTSSSDSRRSTLGPNRARHHTRSGAAEVDDAAVEGLASRKMIHESDRIVSQNDIERQGRTRDAFISRALLAQIAAMLQARRSGEEIVDQEGVEGFVGDDDCMVM